MDGQDGGGNYLRTISAYQKQFQINETILAQKKRIFIEFGAVSLVSTVYLNGHYKINFGRTSYFQLGDRRVSF